MLDCLTKIFGRFAEMQAYTDPCIPEPPFEGDILTASECCEENIEKFLHLPDGYDTLNYSRAMAFYSPLLCVFSGKGAVLWQHLTQLQADTHKWMKF